MRQSTHRLLELYIDPAITHLRAARRELLGQYLVNPDDEVAAAAVAPPSHLADQVNEFHAGLGYLLAGREAMLADG